MMELLMEDDVVIIDSEWEYERQRNVDRKYVHCLVVGATEYDRFLAKVTYRLRDGVNTRVLYMPNVHLKKLVFGRCYVFEIMSGLGNPIYCTTTGETPAHSTLTDGRK